MAEVKDLGLGMAAADSRLYRLNDRRLAAEKDSVEFKEADDGLGQAVSAMKTQMETELARADLATPCRKALKSLRCIGKG